MQIKSLVALLPLLLGQVSSVALPAAPDSCGAVEARLRRNVDLQDVPKHLLSRCVRRRELEAHLELVSRDIQQWEPSNNGQDHIISARAPPKDENEDPPKRKPGRPKGSGKKKDATPAAADPAGSQAEKSAAGKKAGKNQDTTPAAADPAGSQAKGSAKGKKNKEKDPANPAKDQNQPQQHANLPLRPAGNSKQQPQAPADGGDSGEQSGSEAEKKKKTEEEQNGKGKKKAEEQKTNPPSDGPSDGDSSPSESESESESEGEGSGSEFEPGSDSDSDAEREKKKKAKEEERKKKKEAKEKQKQEDDARRPYTMYLNTQPNPKTTEGFKPKGGKEEERYYLRKVGDGLPGHRYKTHSPNHLVTESGDQIPRDKETKQQGPGKVEEKATTKHKGGEGMLEFHKITPFTQEELDKNPETKGKKPWTNDDLADNLIKQHEQFPKHKAGDKTDEFGKTTQEMLKMCKTEQCKAERRRLARRAFPGELHLRRELDTRLQRRDEMMNLAE